MADNYRIVMEVSEDSRDLGEPKDDPFLLKFIQHKKICIQCHDNPDADAVASGYALYNFMKVTGLMCSLYTVAIIRLQSRICF